MAKAPTPSRMVLRRRTPIKTRKSKPSIGKSAPTKVVRLEAKKTVKEREIKKRLSTKDSNLLEIGLLLDCTSSMWSWIDRAKNTLKQIVDNIVKDNKGLQVRVCFVGYRDHCD